MQPTTQTSETTTMNLANEKYGLQLKVINFFHSLPGRGTGHPNDWAVIITLDD